MTKAVCFLILLLMPVVVVEPTTSPLRKTLLIYSNIATAKVAVDEAIFELNRQLKRLILNQKTNAGAPKDAGTAALVVEPKIFEIFDKLDGRLKAAIDFIYLRRMP